MVTISSLSGSVPSPQQPGSSVKLQAAISRLVGLPGIFPVTDIVASLSTVAQLQAQAFDTRTISNNIAQSLSLSQVAEEGVSDIAARVEELQSLSQQPSTPELDARATALRQQITEIAQATSFSGKTLLDGSLSGEGGLSLAAAVSGEDSDSGTDLSIPDLSADALLADNDFSAVTTLLANIREDIDVFQQALSFATANIDAAVSNLLAADSTLEENEALGVLAALQADSDNAVAAQATQLSPTLLKLIN